MCDTVFVVFSRDGIRFQLLLKYWWLNCFIVTPKKKMMNILKSNIKELVQHLLLFTSLWIDVILKCKKQQQWNTSFDP